MSEAAISFRLVGVIRSDHVLPQVIPAQPVDRANFLLDIEEEMVWRRGSCGYGGGSAS